MEMGIGSLLRSSAFGLSASIGVCSGECTRALYATDAAAECGFCEKITCTSCKVICCDEARAESLIADRDEIND